MTRHLISLAAATALVVLAFGSSGTEDYHVHIEDELHELSVEEMRETSVREVLDGVPEGGHGAEAAPSGGYPTTDEGQCCCDFIEADRPVQRFQPEAQCLNMAGACTRDLGPCELAQAKIEAQASQCCCESTERIQELGSPCEGECYEFFEEGDTPGSCVY